MEGGTEGSEREETDRMQQKKKKKKTGRGNMVER